MKDVGKQYTVGLGIRGRHTVEQVTGRHDRDGQDRSRQDTGEQDARRQDTGV
jgi:hypothetical protein